MGARAITPAVSTQPEPPSPVFRPQPARPAGPGPGPRPCRSSSRHDGCGRPPQGARRPRRSAERPTRPLYFRQARSAMTRFRPGGQWRNNYRTRLANRRTNSWSSSTRRAASRPCRRRRAPRSARHSRSATSRAAAVSSSPCRSYRFMARLHVGTTAVRAECRIAGRQENQMIQVRAGQTEGVAFLIQRNPRLQAQVLAAFVVR